MEKEKFYGSLGIRSHTATSKRNAQLKVWEKSETNKQSDSIKHSRLNPKVQFGDDVIFLAAAQNGDVEEVERLLKECTDVNTVNTDGLTALHQCCIDDDFEMVQVLVKHGASLDVQDNEGWSPLHAAASCGHDHTVRFLLDNNAHPALVNNEGDTPLDLVEENDEIATMISTYIETNNIDVDVAKNLEEATMLEDVQRVKNDPTLEYRPSPGGATPLHIASAKGYITVMKMLLDMKVDVDAEDDDGWTPLHAAIYWHNMEGAELLVSHGADLTKTTKAGDTVEDLTDPDLADDLDSLKKLKEEHISRNRRSAMPSRTSRPSLSHSNSREDIGNSRSPNLLRRRSSKEKSLVQKLDKEREKFPEEYTVTTNTTENHYSSSTIQLQEKEVSVTAAEICELPSSALAHQNVNHNIVKNDAKSSAARELAQDNNNSAKEEALNNDHEVQSVKNPSQVVSTNSQVSSSDNSPTHSPIESPKNTDRIIGKIAPAVSPKISKRLGMSPNMLKRVGLWESQTTITPGNAPTPTPLASSTPSTGENPKSNNPPTAEVKRYSFQSKPISLESTSVPHPRALSFDHQSAMKAQGLLSVRKNDQLRTKRSSYDETRIRDVLAPPTKEGGSYKASSLPRGTTIVPPGSSNIASSSLPRGSKINTSVTSSSPEKSEDNPSTDTSDDSPEKNSKLVNNVADTVSSSGLPTPSSTIDSVEVAGGDRSGMSHEVSIDSTSSNTSETRRKQQARRSRQSRQQTQPIDKDIMEKLMLHDSLKEAQEKKTGETHIIAGSSNNDEASTNLKATMSAYKPATRPTACYVNPTPSQSTPLSAIQCKTSGTLTQGSKPTTDNPTDNSPTACTVSVMETDSPSQATSTQSDISVNDKMLTPMHPRTKSANRRKPKKERRSTGLPFEAEQDEPIPEELAKIIVRKPTDGLVGESSLPDLSPQSSMSEDNSESLGDPSMNEELTRVRKLLVEEQQQSQRVYKEKMDVEKEVNKLKSKVSELTRRFGDATRAYEQEKREKEIKDAKIIELENGSKSLQDLRKENQRLKDENSALIRVIGKLSRSPLPSSTV